MAFTPNQTYFIWLYTRLTVGHQNARSIWINLISSPGGPFSQVCYEMARNHERDTGVFVSTNSTILFSCAVQTGVSPPCPLTPSLAFSLAVAPHQPSSPLPTASEFQTFKTREVSVSLWYQKPNVLSSECSQIATLWPAIRLGFASDLEISKLFGCILTYWAQTARF